MPLKGGVHRFRNPHLPQSAAAITFTFVHRFRFHSSSRGRPPVLVELDEANHPSVIFLPKEEASLFLGFGILLKRSSGPMSGEMELHPVRYEFDFEELKASEGYNQPKDFLALVLPLHADGALPHGGKTKERVWYEYPSPFGKDWNLQSTQLQLELKEKLERRSLEEREERRQQLEVDLLKHQEETPHQEESQRQPQDLDLLQETKTRQLQELNLRLSLEERKLRFDVYGNRLEDILGQRLNAVQERLLDAIQHRLVDTIHQHYKELGMMQRHYPEVAVDADEAVERQQIEEKHRLYLEERRLALEDELHRLHQEKDGIYMNEIRSTSECWGLDDQAPTYSSSPARDEPEEHQFHVEEHQVRLKMWENDAENIARYHLFNCEAKIDDLLLESPLEIPYYIYAGRCNHNHEGCKLRYADLFPGFHSWSYSWVRPTTYEGDDQYVDFWSELMEEVEYTNTEDRVLAKAIAIANKSFRKMLYFQIELAVKDCMMLLEHNEKMEQTCHLYGYIASEIYFKKQTYESVLERIMNGHEVLRYELTNLGSDANEDDAWEMREFVSDII